MAAVAADLITDIKSSLPRLPLAKDQWLSKNIPGLGGLLRYPALGTEQLSGYLVTVGLLTHI